MKCPAPALRACNSTGPIRRARGVPATPTEQGLPLQGFLQLLHRVRAFKTYKSATQIS